MSAQHNEIATRLGSQFALAVANFLPAMSQGLHRNPEKGISCGATVKLQIEKGVVLGTMTLHEPKIPMDPMEPIPFVLKAEEGGQLSLLFEGSLKDLEAEVRRQAASTQQPTDDLDPPSNNRSKRLR